MKNEDKIVELLSTQIHKQDNQEELLKRLVKAVDDLTEVISVNFKQVNDHEKRISRLEDKMFK